MSQAGSAKGSATPLASVAGSAAASAAGGDDAASVASKAPSNAASAAPASAAAASVADAAGDDAASAAQDDAAAPTSEQQQPSGATAGGGDAEAAADAAPVADPEPEPEPSGGGDATPSEPKSEPPKSPRKRRAVRKKKERPDDSTPAYDASSSIHSPQSDTRYNQPPDASAALRLMQDKVELPEPVRRQIAEKQRQMDRNRARPASQPYGKHQPGIPNALAGHVEMQDYGGGNAEPSEDSYVAYVASERHSAEYRHCGTCGMALASAPYCPMTGARHVPAGLPQQQQQQPQHRAPFPQDPCDVVPEYVPAQRGSRAPNVTPQHHAVPHSPPSRLSVADSLPYATADDAAPLRLEELSRGGGGARRDPGIDWRRVKELADSYARSGHHPQQHAGGRGGITIAYADPYRRSPLGGVGGVTPPAAAQQYHQHPQRAGVTPVSPPAMAPRPVESPVFEGAGVGGGGGFGASPRQYVVSSPVDHGGAGGGFPGGSHRESHPAVVGRHGVVQGGGVDPLGIVSPKRVSPYSPQAGATIGQYTQLRPTLSPGRRTLL